VEHHPDGLELAVVGTYLDVLVELLGDEDQQAAYADDPQVWLRAAGVGFLCGEDVVAAGPVLAGWRPELATACDVLDGVDPQPAPGETELAAAVRVLDALLEAAPRRGPRGPRRSASQGAWTSP
jgi:transposase InsO family protein